LKFNSFIEVGIIGPAQGREGEVWSNPARLMFWANVSSFVIYSVQQG